MDRFEITIQHSLAGAVPIAAEWTRADGSPPVHSAGELKLDRAALEAEKDVRAYGEMLGRAVFDEEIGIAFAQAEAAAVNRLHVLLEVEDLDLKGLRWQRLCALRDGAWRHLMLGRRTPFSLYVPSPIDRRFVPFGRSELRTLIVAASPAGIKEAHGLDPFDPKEAIAAVKSSLGDDIPCYVLADVPDADGPPTLEALTKAISGERFPLVHFVCHGAVREDRQKQRYTFLYLNDVNGRTDPVDAGRLVDNLANLNGPYGLPHFVFLAACEGAGPTATGAYGGLAEQLVRDLGMPAVLAMTEPISVETANDLAKAFYKSVREHGEIDRALGEACAGLAEAGDVTVPAIFSRLGTRSLFAGADRAPSDDETEEGLTLLDVLFMDRAPVLRDRLAAAANKLRRTLGIAPGSLNEAARAEKEAARSEIDALCSEVLECSFASLATEKKFPDYNDHCPFRGLEAFSTDDKDFFFGRAPEIARLKQRLCEHPFLAVVGRSGSGKSSLVLAGLLPQLRTENPPPEGGDCALPRTSVVCEPDSEPLANLERAVAVAADGALIVVDQFEEVFTHGASEAEQVDFFSRLMDLGATHPIVITLRDDFVADCARHDRLREAVQRHQELIAPMTAEALRDAIGRQASAVGLDFEAGLANTIVTELGDEPGAMSLLQYTLLRLWERRHGRWLRAAEYEAIGRVQGALAQRAEDVFCALDPGESDCERLTERRGRARQIFVRLTRLDDREDDAPPRDTRQRVALRELVPAQEALAATEAIVEQLVGARLLVKSTRPRRLPSGSQSAAGAVVADPGLADEEMIELSHEALIRHWPRLQRWIEEDRDHWRLQQEVGAAARKWRQAPVDNNRAGYLYRDPPLLAAEALLRQSQVQLNTDEYDFITASVAEREREAAEKGKQEARQRHLTTMIARISTVSAIVFLVLLIIARVLWVRAEEQTEIARTQTGIAEAQTRNARLALSRQLGIAADQLREQEFSQSLLLSREAMVFGDTLTARGSMLSGLMAHPGLMSFLRGHRDSVTAVAFAPDGEAVASGARSGAVLISDLQSGQLLGPPLIGEQARQISILAFNGDGLLLAAGDERGRVEVWDRAAPTEPIATIWAGPALTTIVFSPDDSTLLTAGGGVSDMGEDPKLQQWNLATGELQSEHSFEVTDDGEAPDGAAPTSDGVSIVLSDDGRQLALGTANGRIELWDTDDAAAPTGVRFLAREDAGCGQQAGPMNVAALAFGATGQVLASAYGDGCLALWDVEGLESLANIDLGVRGLTAVTTTADGSSVATINGDPSQTETGGNGGITVWRPFDESVRISTLLPVAEPACADFGKAQSPAIGGEAGVFPGPTHLGAQAIALSADGHRLVAGGESCAVAMWRLDGESLLGRRVGGTGQAAASIAFSADGHLLAAAGCGGAWIGDTCGTETVSVWQTADGSPVHAPFTAGDNRFSTVAFGPGSLLAAGGCSTVASSEAPCRLGVVRLWDAATGRPAGPPILGHAGWVEGIAIAANGTTLVSAGSDGVITVWNDVTTVPQRALEITAHEGGVTTLAFVSDDLLASGGMDGEVRLWNLSAADPEGSARVLRGHSESISGLAVDPNGILLASSSHDGSVIMWSIETGQRLLRPLVASRSPQLDVAFSRDGTTLATLDRGSGVTLWDATTRQQIGTGLRALWGTATAAVAFSPTADLLASGGDDVPTLLWDMDPAVWAERVCALATRNLVWVEWNRYLAEYPYPEQPRCPGEPVFTERLRMADSYALAGQSEQAKRLFAQVVAMVAATGDAALNADVCWTGSFDRLDNLAMPACDRAVELRPADAEFHDARGVARALAGDTAGAIEDFAFYIEWVEAVSYPEDRFLWNKRAERQRWVDALRAGDDPFTPGTLEALRNEVDRRHVGLG